MDQQDGLLTCGRKIQESAMRWPHQRYETQQNETLHFQFTAKSMSSAKISTVNKHSNTNSLIIPVNSNQKHGRLGCFCYCCFENCDFPSRPIILWYLLCAANLFVFLIHAVTFWSRKRRRKQIWVYSLNGNDYCRKMSFAWKYMRRVFLFGFILANDITWMINSNHVHWSRRCW